MYFVLSIKQSHNNYSFVLKQTIEVDIDIIGCAGFSRIFYCFKTKLSVFATAGKDVGVLIAYKLNFAVVPLLCFLGERVQ